MVNHDIMRFHITMHDSHAVAKIQTLSISSVLKLLFRVQRAKLNGYLPLRARKDNTEYRNQIMFDRAARNERDRDRGIENFSVLIEKK